MEGLQGCLLCISPATTHTRDVSSASPCVNSNFLLVLLSSQPSAFPLLLSLLLESGWRFFSFPSTQRPALHMDHFTATPYCWLQCKSFLILIIRQGLCLSCIKISSNSFSKFLWKSPLTVPAVPGNPDKGFVPGAGLLLPEPAAPGVTAPPGCHRALSGLCLSLALHVLCPLLWGVRGRVAEQEGHPEGPQGLGMVGKSLEG